jgi:hypothetical protein
MLTGAVLLLFVMWSRIGHDLAQDSSTHRQLSLPAHH